MMFRIIVNGRKVVYPLEICPTPVLIVLRKSCWSDYFSIKKGERKGDISKPQQAAVAIQDELTKRNIDWNQFPKSSLPSVVPVTISDQIADEIPVNVVQFPVQKSA